MRLLSFEQTLDTILEADLPQTQPYLPQPSSVVSNSLPFSNSMPANNGQTPADQSAQTATYNPAQPMNQQLYQAAKVREQLQAQHIAAMPIDQKITLALQKATEAEKVAYRTSRDVSDINAKLDRIFKELSGQISRVSGGQAAKEPDPPGSSIWGDDEDPDSIWTGMR